MEMGSRRRDAIQQMRPPSNGIGLTNTAERLRTSYGDDQRFLARSLADGGYEATIEIPFRKAGPSAEGAMCAR